MDMTLRIEGLKFLAVGANPDADLDAAVAEMIERSNLLRRHDDVTSHRQHENAGAEFQFLGMGGEKGIGDQRLPEAWRSGKFRADIVLGGHVIVAPDRMIPERFSVLCDADQRFWFGERDRISQSL